MSFTVFFIILSVFVWLFAAAVLVLSRLAKINYPFTSSAE